MSQNAAALIGAKLMRLWRCWSQGERLAGLLVLFLAVCLLLLPTPVFAQGCPMCQLAAKAQAPHAQKALDVAILILLVPPVVIMGGILTWTFRYRNSSLQK